jgi:hypothetical protein
VHQRQRTEEQRAANNEQPNFPSQSKLLADDKEAQNLFVRAHEIDRNLRGIIRRPLRRAPAYRSGKSWPFRYRHRQCATVGTSVPPTACTQIRFCFGVKHIRLCHCTLASVALSKPPVTVAKIKTNFRIRLPAHSCFGYDKKKMSEEDVYP